METFREAGQVTALPTVDKSSENCETTLRDAEQHPQTQVSVGEDLIPNEYIEAHRLSLGLTSEQYAERLRDRRDVLLTRNGVSAYVGAQDFQFTTRKEVVLKVLPLEVRDRDEYYDPIYSPVFEAKINELGYWRLSTTGYYVHHMGNRVPDFRKEMPWLSYDPLVSLETKSRSDPSIKQSRPLQRRILRNRYVRRGLKWLNVLTYRWLCEG
jgi:hypothetical protein